MSSFSFRFDCLDDAYREVYTFLDSKGASVGSFKLDCTTDPDVSLWSFIINPSFRGYGYGKRMAKEIVKMASERGFNSIWLYVDKLNEPAIKCYKKAGFEIVGVDLYTPGTFDMQLVLKGNKK